MVRASSRRQPAVLRVLHVGVEIFPLVKTGGLADVLGALPAALAQAGADVRVLLPALSPLRAAMRDAHVVAQVELPWGGEPAELLRGHFDVPALAHQPAYLLRHDALYARSGTPYGYGSGKAYADNHRRFALLGLAAARLAEGLDPAWLPQLLHGHDWHAGLAAAYLAFSRAAGRSRAASVFTVHNLAYRACSRRRCSPSWACPPRPTRSTASSFTTSSRS